jgi:ATP-dependent exoDNAse (exonuclease V) beta subunit
MHEAPADRIARDRFRDEWNSNFAVAANAGSGKTTAISERLAALALAPEGTDLLRRTAVVTFTNKAAAQIGQRARQVLVRRLAGRKGPGLDPLDALERAFFGTIHSFCILLSQRYGLSLGLNLNPRVIEGEEAEDIHWEEFLEEDAMDFTALSPAQVGAFLRHTPIDRIFPLARDLDAPKARCLIGRAVAAGPPEPSAEALREIQAARSRAGKASDALRRNQELAASWLARFREERGFLRLPEPEGKAAGIDALFARFLAPVKSWLADAGAVLAAELALRYRAWRFDRGIQTYADQVEAAAALLDNPAILDRVRSEGWRILLDEAQDTDPQQLAVLVEIARPPGAPRGSWPGGGPGPRPGHFCMVGDAQQSIYGGRADVANFQRHLDAFSTGDDGELLTFDVTFRVPTKVASLLNPTLGAAFGPARDHNLEPSGGGPRLAQAPYGPLVPGPRNPEGAVGRLALDPAGGPQRVGPQFAAEARQLADRLSRGGPAAVGAGSWGDICILAPRNDWLIAVRKEFEEAGLRVALQSRKSRNGDNPVYAWICGLLMVVDDPENVFEWTGVLREVFAVSDAAIAALIRREKRIPWDEPERTDEPVRSALAAIRPLILRAGAEGEPLGRFAADLAAACGLREKARLADRTGALTGELDRLLSRAVEIGLAGGGPRAWRTELLADLDAGRPAGKAEADAINLLTSHSAKGLEWPVVIPVGVWREVSRRNEGGLQLVSEGGSSRVYYDAGSIPAEAKEAGKRAQLRENARLLYVTLTRARRVLVLPWGSVPEAEGGSFADLWGMDLSALDELSAPVPEPGAAPPAEIPRAPASPGRPPASAVLPARILPHELARAPDLARSARHEAAPDGPGPARPGEDPLDYGLWWHETMEFLPWTSETSAYGARALAAADALGFRPRAEEEWRRLLASEAWGELASPRWRRLAELAVFAPWRDGAWIDGVIDLVLHDPASNQLWVVDWKTNRRREGESDAELLSRLASEYEPQLSAYGSCLAPFFPGCKPRLLVYSTAAAAWTEVAPALPIQALQSEGGALT